MATSGVKQGWSVQFGVVMDLILHGLLKSGLEAFALIDDLTIAAETEEDLRSALIEAQALLSTIGLVLNFWKTKMISVRSLFKGEFNLPTSVYNRKNWCGS